MPVKPDLRTGVRVVAFGIALGAAIQLGAGLTSLALPTVKKIEIHAPHQGAAAAPDRMSF